MLRGLSCLIRLIRQLRYLIHSFLKIKSKNPPKSSGLAKYYNLFGGDKEKRKEKPEVNLLGDYNILVFSFLVSYPVFGACIGVPTDPDSRSVRSIKGEALHIGILFHTQNSNSRSLVRGERIIYSSNHNPGWYYNILVTITHI